IYLIEHMIVKAYKELEARQRFQSARGDAPSDALWRVRFRALRDPAASALHKGGWVFTFAAAAYNLGAGAGSAVTRVQSLTSGSVSDGLDRSRMEMMKHVPTRTRSNRRIMPLMVTRL